MTTTPSDDERLMKLAEAVADGLAVDWTEAEDSATTAEQRRVIGHLNILAKVTKAMRQPPSTECLGPSPVGTPSGGLLAGARWGPLAIREMIGAGTFGAVYRAWDPRLEREVALKLLHQTEDQDLSSSVIEEGRLLARVRHKNVVTVYGADRFDGLVGIWMELIDGRTLDQIVSAQGPLGAHEATLVGIDLCSALAAIHKAGMLHRDIKARNIMREAGGRIVLMDLGAGHTRANPPLPSRSQVGTPLYLAPELLIDDAPSVATDIYSVGVTLYRLVTNAYPVTASTVEELKLAHIARRINHLHDERPDLPTHFIQVVERAIAFQPADRPQTAGEMQLALTQSLDFGDDATVQRPRGPAHRLWVAGISLLFAVLGLALIVTGVWHRPNRSSPPQPTGGTIRSIAVLPFKDLSGNPANAYLADAVPLELTSRLGQFGAVKVIPWTFVKQLQPSHSSLQQIMTATGADGVVEGSIQVLPSVQEGSASRVRVMVQLYRAQTESLIWSKSFDDDLTNFLAMENVIADGIAQRIQLTIAVRGEMRPAARQLTNPDAMELYLKGRELWIERDSPNQLQRARDYFELAIAKDASFAEAYSGVADCYAMLGSYWAIIAPHQAYLKVIEATDRGLAIDNTLPDLWASRAYARFLLAWDWAGAEADFTKAESLGDRSELLRSWHAEYLTAMGRHAEAIAESKAALDEAPQSPHLLRRAAWSYFFAREYDEAIRRLQDALRIDPNYVPARSLLGRAYVQKGLYSNGIAELDALAQARTGGTPYPPMLAYAYARSAQRATALTTLRDYVSRSMAPIYPYEVATAYAAIGDNALALDWLDRAYRNHDPSMTHVLQDPRLDSIRRNARFVALTKLMSFPGRSESAFH